MATSKIPLTALGALVLASGVAAPLLPHRAVAPAAVSVQRAAPGVWWPHYGRDPAGTRYSPLTDIDRETVSRLRPAWEWRTGERPWRDPVLGHSVTPHRFQATPIVMNDTMYLSTPYSRAVALDAHSGAELWAFDPGAYRRRRPRGRSGFVHRGVALWSDGQERRVFLNSRWRLIALDAATGRRIPSFGRAGEVDLTEGLRWPVDRDDYHSTSPPLVFEDLVIVGSSIGDYIIHPVDPPGEVQAFDARSGQRVWTWSPVPAAGEPGYETWAPGSAEVAGHLNVWAPMSVDSSRGLLFLPVSTPSNDWYGGARKGANLFAESLVCLDARTGRRVWHYQLVHHGLWDYDPASQPVLITVSRGGVPVDAVALAAKTGFVYAFERESGVPLWPIEERPVPTSDVPGEQTHSTQPFPTRPPPFAEQGFGPEDIVDFTPEIRALAVERLKGLRVGPLFTPPSLEGTVVMPGWTGGAGWGGGAFDPTTGTLYVKATNRPSLGRLVEARVPREPIVARYILDPSIAPDGALDLSLPTFLGRRNRSIPIIRPPYGTLTAIDMNQGRHRWQITIGDLPEIHRHPMLRGVKLPPLGVPGAPGPMVTAGGLLFLTGGGNVLFAVDKDDGRVLWQYDLGDSGYSNPMTYRTSRGRQFVVVAVGTGARSRLVAFALAGSRMRR